MCCIGDDSTHQLGYVLCDLTDLACLWLLWSYDLATLWVHHSLIWRCTRSCGMPSRCQDTSWDTSSRRLSRNDTASSSASHWQPCGAVSRSHLILFRNNRQDNRGVNIKSAIIWFSSYWEPIVEPQDFNCLFYHWSDSQSSGGGSARRLCRLLNQTRKQILKICLEHIKGKNCTVRGSPVWEAYAGGLMQLVNKALLGFLNKITQREREKKKYRK